MLKHELMEQVYDALVAQLDLNIHHYDRGLVIKVSGFNHKLHVRFSLLRSLMCPTASTFFHLFIISIAADGGHRETAGPF